MRSGKFALALALICVAGANAFADEPAGVDKNDVKAWAERTIQKAGWTYMGVVGRSAAPFALYMTEGPASPDVKRAIWLRNEYMVETNGYRSLQALLDIDCSMMKVRIKTSIAFKQNNLKDRVSLDEQPSAWQPAQPGSVLSGVVRDTCVVAAARPPVPASASTSLPAAPIVTKAQAAGTSQPAEAPPARAAGVAAPGSIPQQDVASLEAPPRARPVEVDTDTSAPKVAAMEAPAMAAATLKGPSTGDISARGPAPSAASPPPTPPTEAAAAIPRPRPALSALNTVGRTRAAPHSPPQPPDGPKLQLGAYGTRALAEDAAVRLKVKEPHLLDARATEIQSFESEHGTVFRLLVGPFADAREAEGVCEGLKGRGRACFLRR